jgi:hypothetical protein
MSPDSKKSLLRILFVTSLILLVSELVLEKLYPGVSVSAENSFSEPAADSVFRDLLSDFGLHDSWIKKKQENYIIKLPADLPAEVLLLDLSDRFRNSGVDLESKEILKGSRSLLKIDSNDSWTIQAEFSYDKSLRRETSSISFLLTGLEELKQAEKNFLLNSQENFTVAVTPSKANRNIADILKNRRKEYALLLNNEVDELEYRVDDKFSDKKIKTTIQTIFAHFEEAAFIILDKNSEHLSPRVTKLIENEIGRRKMKYYFLNHFKSTADIGNTALKDMIVKGEDLVLTIKAVEYLQLSNQIINLRKMGYKFMNISALNVH